MSRSLKISLKIAIAIITIIILTWLGAAYYINHNNKTILTTILSQLNSTINGKIEVKSMETTLFKGFPGVSVSLKKVQLRDSLWSQHQHSLVNAEDIEVSLNILSLITGNININKIGINNANIYVYTAPNGYSNTSIFKAKSEPSSSKKDQNAFKIKRVDFNNVNLIIDNQKRFKLFNFAIKEIKGKINYADTGWNGKINLTTNVKNFAFNTNRGSFLKDKIIKGTLIAHYNEKSQEITIDQEKLSIGGDEFYIGAKISVAENKPAFAIAVRADKILYKNISLLLAPNISTKLLKFNIDQPIAVDGTIIDDGNNTATDPLINVKMTVKNNTVSFPSGQLTKCNFTGTFTNKDTVGKVIGDSNSAIRFFALTGDYYNVPLKLDTFSISNLERPIAVGLVTSQFPLEKLNESLGGETLNFKNGLADVKLYCKADIENFNFTKPELSGNVFIKNADITYLPKNMKLVNSSLTLNFDQKNLKISNSRFQLGKSILNMNCSIENFLNFYYTAPEKIQVDLKLNSPQLNLGELMFLLSQRKTIKRNTKNKNSIKEVIDQLSTVLEASKVNILLNVNQATYNRFVAKNLNANISLVGNGINLNKINVSHAGGNVNLSGKITQSGDINKFNINSNINGVSIMNFFYAFNNFGQNSITDKNIRGYLSAKVNTNGSISSNGDIIKKSMYGQVIFTLNKAALVNFEPIKKVGKFAFPNRNLSNIEIAKLNGTLTLSGDKVDISPMQVNSSVLNFNVKGIYGLNNGTDISMDIPLRNPKKNIGIIDKEELELARMKGIVLHLKAIDDGKGGIKVKWNSDHD